MAGSAGSLVVSLGLNAAEFVQGLSKAEYQAQKSLNNISKQLGGISSGFKDLAAAVGVGLSVDAIVEWSKSVVDGAKALQDLSVATGSSVEELSRLSNIAKINGDSFETFQRSIERLAAGLAGSEELSTKTANALKFLGVSSKDPATAMQEIANRLNQFADGAGKAAIARDLFGRSGVAFLATLKDIATETDITATKTAEQARQADELAKTFNRLTIESHGLADAFLSSVAPALEKVAGLLLESTKRSGGFFAALVNAANINPFGNIVQQISQVSAEIEKAEAKAAKAKDNGALFQFSIGPNEQEYVNQLKARLEILKRIQVTQADVNNPNNFDSNDRRLNAKPLLPYVSTGNNAAAAVDDPSRKILEGQLKALDANIQSEKDLLDARKQFLDAYYDQGLISNQHYYDTLQGERDEALKNTLDNYNKEIEAAKEYQAQATKLTDKQSAQNKIDEITDKQAKAAADAITQSNLLSIARSQADAKYIAELDEINAKLLELAGNTAAAGTIRFNAQNQGLANRLAANGDTGGQAALADLQQRLNLQNQLNDAQQRANGILGSVAIQQGRINLQQRVGAISEIEALTKSSELNKSRLAELQAIYEKMAEIAAQPFATQEQINQAAAMKLAVEELAASTDLLADKFNKTFGDAFATMISDVATGTKSIKDAFNDMAKSITKSIADIAAQSLASKLFGQGGGASGIGELLAKLFGAGGGSGFNYFAGDGAFLAAANGTNSSPGGMTLVGEHGPEIVNLPRGAQVIPNEVLMAKRNERTINVTQHINVMPGASTQSARQAGALIREAVTRSARDR